MPTDEYYPIKRLWILRILQFNNAIYRFVRKNSFEDDQIARFLNLEHWLGESGASIQADRAGKGRLASEFNQNSIIEEIRKLQKLSESLTLKSCTFLPKFFENNCRYLQDAYGLTDLEKDLISFQIIVEQDALLGDALEYCESRSRKSYAALLAFLLDRDPQLVGKATAGGSRLMRLRLLEWADSSRRSSARLTIGRLSLSEEMYNRPCDPSEIIREIVSDAPAATLTEADYPHMEKTLKPLQRHLRSALTTQSKGVNIFIYGAPGTGKSELSRVLAQNLGVKLYEVSCEDEEGHSIRPDMRLTALTQAQELMRSRQLLLLFDEAEDIFGTPSLFSKSIASDRKGWINRLLENNPVPTLWISNSVRNLDPAFVRRFDFIFELNTPPRHLREDFLKRVCGEAIPKETLQRIADCDALTPAVITRAKELAEKVCADTDPQAFNTFFESQLKQTLKAQGHGTESFTRKSSKVPPVYALNYLNCDKDLTPIAPALREQSDCRICLYGPPGTGKTTLGHWLSKETHRPIHLKKASDLLGSYLGETERALAEAFKNASEENAILMIDEIDSFLQDRQGALRSWEVQQVNELLTQMENFEGTFIASTNLMEGIDLAALRRFDLKLRFDYLRPEQNQELLQRYAAQLQLPEVSSEGKNAIARLGNCTPGDFANAARQHRFRQFASTDAFAHAVADECQIKVERNGGRQLGFV